MLLTQDAELARNFMVRELGTAAESTAAAAELRETVATYLSFDRSLAKAAEHLHVARNTVAYRVKKFENLIGRDQEIRPVGDVDAHALDRAGILVGLGEEPPAVPARLSDPAGQPARVARLERALQLVDPAAVLGQGAAKLLRVVEEDVDPDPRVRARHARHVPNDPPAADSGSCPSTRTEPAWLRTTFASACGRWLVSAIRRSWAAGSIATGTAPSEATKLCRAGSAGLGLGDRRQEPGGALEELLAPARRARAPPSRRPGGRR